MRRWSLLAVVGGLGFVLLFFDALANGGGGLGGGYLVRLGSGTVGALPASLSSPPSRDGTLGSSFSAPAVPGASVSAPAVRAEAKVVTTTQMLTTTTVTEKKRERYGFYLHVFRSPEAVIFQVRELKRVFPSSPVYIMSDGGLDFGALCKAEGCTFALCPPVNDRWHPWPFFRRIYDAAVALEVDYVIMLEPDNTIHGPITRHPTADAGGLFVEQRGFGLTKYVEKLAQERVPGYKWTKRMMQAGLAGGSYYRREAILDAFSDDAVSRIDWNWIGEHASKEMFSSDFAMQYALAARGYTIEPWDDCAQMDRDKDKPLTGAVDSAFRHYCSCYPGGKPTYNLQVAPADQQLFKEVPDLYRRYQGSVCQLCYNHTRYVELYGSSTCTVDRPVTYTERLMQIHHPELKDGCPDFLPWLCAKGEMYHAAKTTVENSDPE